MYDYDGTTTLITGASKGIGDALARDVAARGGNLVLVARSATKLDALAAQIRDERGVQVDVFPADLSDRDAPAAVVQELGVRGLDVDLLVNNAGLGAVGPFLSRPFEHNVQSVDLNVMALMGLTHLLGTRMVGRGRGGIINVASLAAFQPMPYQASYGATKAFVLSFTEALAEELDGTGVHVMAAHPGPVDTGFFDGTTVAIDPKAVSPARIAAKSLDDFAHGRSASFPGGGYATTFLSRVLPRTSVTRIVGRLARKNGYDAAADIAPPER
jgi:short-subunit dehydrogenase